MRSRAAHTFVACLPQVRLAYDVFMLSGVLTELGIPASELTGFLSAVSAHYHSPEDVPYHNLAHVVQVLHGVWLVSHISAIGQLGSGCIPVPQ
jgi:hypothetical protein